MRYARTRNRGEGAGRVLLTLEHTVVGRLDVARWVPELDRSEDGLDPAEVLHHARVGEGSFRRREFALAPPLETDDTANARGARDCSPRPRVASGGDERDAHPQNNGGKRCPTG